jgi:preprotein translocase subunit SecA
MIDKVSKILLKVFGSRNERLLKNIYRPIALKAGEFEEQIQQLDEEALRAKTFEL